MNIQAIFSIVERALMLPLLAYILFALRITDLLRVPMYLLITTKVWLFLGIICLVLLVLAFILADPIIYATGFGFFVIISNYINVPLLFIMIFTSLLMIMFILNTIKTGWRNGQPKSLGIVSINKFHTMLAVIIFLMFFILIPYLNSELAGIIVSLFLRIPQPKDSALIPLWAFMTSNIIGESIIVGIVLAITYKLVQEIGSTISMYIVPSRSAVIEDAIEWLNKETWLEPALRYVGSFAESIIIAPPIYSVVMILIEQVTKTFGILRMNPFILNVINFIIALGVLFFVWRFISRIISFEPIRPSLRPILFVGITIILMYLAIYIKYSVIINPFNPSFTAFDSYIFDTYISFYSTLFFIVQWILILMGAAP
ncbi:MAG: hypothetical protein ACP5GU_06060 [Thermoprotei archaeon]|jgi:hypothetical protein